MDVERDPAADQIILVLKPVGPTCSWCLGLSAKSFEGQRVGRGHRDCDCKFVQLRVDEPQPSWLRDLLMIIVAARLAAARDDDPSHDEAYYVRRLYPDDVTDGVWERPPRFEWAGPVPTWDGPHPPDNRSATDQGYWQARQEATGIEARGEKLTPREILFVERGQALGESVEWIRRGQSTTNDFRWRGEDFELKSPNAEIGTIARDISTDRRRKGRTNFVIDIGTAPIPVDLISQMSHYNELHSLQIRSLWLMSNGQLIEIPMR